jgi:hypothetical protein
VRQTFCFELHGNSQKVRVGVCPRSIMEQLGLSAHRSNFSELSDCPLYKSTVNLIFIGLD